ncbi:hypothetical protein Tco_1044774 [Tanacetum coccineum]|uniref:Uncharacterized protein n=1 Tax=Tanacetum coccineum TaxID=301880 RepID=A0ABQ5GS01_9ASTR
MANIRTYNKHNMIACVEKTEHNADFHQIVDYLTAYAHYNLLLWKYLVHVLLHCLSPKSTSWEQCGTNIASALALAAEEAHRVSILISRAEVLQGISRVMLVSQWYAEAQSAADIPQSPNDYTPTDASQTSGGDEGLLDLYALNREVRRLKKQTISQAKQIHKLTANKKLSKGVKAMVKHHLLWVKSQKLKKRGTRQKKKVSSVKLGRNKDEGNLSEEHHDHDDHNHTAFVYEDPDLERKSDETEQMITEEKDTSDVKSGDTEELDLERIQNRPRGLSIPGPMHSQPQQPTQSTDHLRKKNQEDWEIIRWRLNESSGVHTLELEDGTMLHMLTERRYPLSRELMIRMLDHGMEVEDESETAITLIHLFILWTTEDGDDS